jgi:four helix bundle protein
MSRDHTKLRFFPIADQLVLDVYLLTKSLPDVERYGLQSQIRRAAVSVVTNIVEGAAHRSDPKYVHHLEISLGSAQEVRYLIDLTARLKLLSAAHTKGLVDRYTEVIKSTQALISTIVKNLT